MTFYKKYIIAIMTMVLTLFTSVYADEEDMVFTPQNEQTVQQINEKAFSPLLLSPTEVLFTTSQKKIDVIDPSFSASYYPGGRGANKLVIYTPKYGIHTGTNEFGTEAIVEENTVTALSGADSTIPKNGLVISGHGTAKNWISQNISVGSKIYIDTLNRVLTVYTTSESYMYEAKAKIKEVKSMIDYCKNNYPRYNSSTPENHIKSAENYLMIAEKENHDPILLKKYTQEAIEEVNLAIQTALPFVNDEMRGTWIRPTETTEEQIRTTLDNIKANGFNAIFLETYYHGKTIFPSKTMNKYGFTVQNELFEDFDALKVWIHEAHKRGIKVHIWFQSFYVGNQPPIYDESSILAVRPDWGNKTKRYADAAGATRSVSEHNGYFIDPSNPEVQEFLLELLEEIITTYKPDGINLDYIRYPNENSANIQNTWGYTKYARNKFKELYEIDPIDITKSDVQWYDWNRFRRDNVTEFVRKAGELGRENEVYVSAVIFPDIASALSTKQQDWRTWSQNDYIDGFTPLFLTYDYQMLASMMNDVLRIKSGETDIFAGLFVTFMGGASEDLIRQIYQTRVMKSNGVIIFDWAHTTSAYTSALTASVFNSGTRSQNNLIAKKSKKKVFQKEERKERKQPTGRVVTTTNRKGSWVFVREEK